MSDWEKDVSYDSEDWNMAKAYLARIDRILTMCDECQVNNRPVLWLKYLKCLYKEVMPKVKEDEKQNRREQAQILLHRCNEEINRASKGTQRVGVRCLWDLELFLRQVLEDKGMLTPKADDPSKAYRYG